MTIPVPAAPPPRRPLVPRELQVLQGIALGLSYAEIADHLNIARDTAGAHIRNLYRKLGATGGAHAVHIAYTAGVFTVAPRLEEVA